VLRRLTHVLVLGTAVVPVSITMASAAQPGAHVRQRLEMQAPQSALASLAATPTTRLELVALDTAQEAATAPEPPAPPIVVATRAAAAAPGGAHGNFPRGYCTWYVSTRRNIPWNGNAIAWYAAAKALGFPVGATPEPGAIMVSRESWIGHVAYVESVDGDSFTISEMNYKGFGVVDQRRVRIGHIPLVGFIY
jgi:peptidoglycan DL-endopeptidase CwlO